MAYGLTIGAIGLTAMLATGSETTEKLNFVERASSDTITHVGGKSDGPGDLLTFANDVYDQADKAKIGTDQGYCIRIVAGKSFECFWTLILAAGQITVEGPFFDAGDSVLAVTGGTGKYASARGEMTLHARDAKGTEYAFGYALTYPK